MNTAELSRTWRELSLAYVAGVNEFVALDIATQGKSGLEPPAETRADIAPAVLDAVRQANRAGKLDGLRALFPPAIEPYFKALENAPAIEPLLLPDGTIVARVGKHYQENRLGYVLISGTSYQSIEGMLAIGRCPRRRYYAVADETGVNITDGWRGPVTKRLAFPTGLEGMPDGYKVTPSFEAHFISTLTPFPDGERVLLASNDGVWALTENGAVRLLPTEESLSEYFQESLEDAPDYALSVGLSMEHGAVSANGRWIAAGCQDGKHLLFSASTYEPVAHIGPHGEYPHFAVFSADDGHVAFNACHFYNGATMDVALADAPGMDTEFYADDPRIRVIDDDARVYAGVGRGDAFLLGDAYGYVRGCGIEDGLRWRHFIGGTVAGMDISADGKRLVVGTFAGVLADITLDAAEMPDPFVVGYGASYRETRRYLFWGEPDEMLVW